MLLAGNGRLITRGARNKLVENGCVAADGRLITEVGGTAELRAKYPGAEFIDARGGVIMPGLINAHNHIYSAFARGLSINGYAPKDFLDILNGLWWNIDRRLTVEDTYWSAMATYIDCIKNGCTTVFDHHAGYGGIRGSLFAIADAARTLGVRACMCFEVSDRNGEGAMREAVAENKEFIAMASSDGSDMVKGMMGLHASFTLSDKTLQLCRENTPKGVGFHIHVAEGMDDVYDSLKKYGKRVVNRLFDHDITGTHTILGHCIHINGIEMDIIRETGAMVVHNPESNMGNAVGIPPCIEMLRRGILLGLGTDGYTNDMLESEKVTNIIHKHVLADPGAGWSEAPEMLFGNNAKIGGRFFDTKLGVLEPGAAADIIVLDYDPPTPMTAGNIDSHILFGMSGRSVSATIINGEVKMKERRLVDADETEVMTKCREHAAALARRVNA